jgi:hypothetical protein
LKLNCVAPLTESSLNISGYLIVYKGGIIIRPNHYNIMI